MILDVDLRELHIAASRMIDRPTPSLDESYLAGMDAATNGANTDNCHFSFFETKELTEAWERGNRKG